MKLTPGLDSLINPNNSSNSPVYDNTRYTECSFATIPFRVTKITTKFTTFYTEYPTSVTTPQNLVEYNQNAIDKSVSQIVNALGSGATQFKISGYAYGVEERQKLMDVFTKYNEQYVNPKDNKNDSNMQKRQVNVGGAEIKLFLTVIKNAMVLNATWNEDPLVVGKYDFEVEVRSLQGVVNFIVKDSSLKAKSNIFGTPNSLLNKCINAIKDFNLAYWEASLIDMYNNFMNYSGINDLMAMADTIKNLGNGLNSLTSLIFGDGDSGGLIRSTIKNMINSAESFAKAPEEMFKSMSNLFDGILSVTANPTGMKKVFNDIINSDVKPITSTPSNAVKIINNKFMYNLMKAHCFTAYCNESLKTPYIYGDEIKEERKKIFDLYRRINPILFNEELELVMISTMESLNNLAVNSAYVVEINVSNTALIPLAYGWFNYRINEDDLILIRKLNPNIDFNNINGIIRLPSKKSA